MSCGCNKNSSFIPQSEPPKEEQYVNRYDYFKDYSTLEKQMIAENLGFASGNTTVVNYPDEEDLTSQILESTKVLRFKDKSYDPYTFSGKGRKFLRKNIKSTPGNCSGSEKNILTQEMFYDCDGYPLINTIFIIQYDYDLEGQTIEIPAESTLFFMGGSLQNGRLVFNNTLILPAGIDLNHVTCNDNTSDSINPCSFGDSGFRAGTIVINNEYLQYWNGQQWVSIGRVNSPLQGKTYNLYLGVTGEEYVDMKRIPFSVGAESDIYNIQTKNSQKVILYVPTAIKDSILIQLHNDLIIPNDSSLVTITENEKVINCTQYSKLEITYSGLIQIKTLV